MVPIGSGSDCAEATAAKDSTADKVLKTEKIFMVQVWLLAKEPSSLSDCSDCRDSRLNRWLYQSYKRKESYLSPDTNIYIAA